MDSTQITLAAGIPSAAVVAALVTVAVQRERQSNTDKRLASLQRSIEILDEKLDEFQNHPYHDFKQEMRRCLSDMRLEIELLKRRRS